MSGRDIIDEDVLEAHAEALVDEALAPWKAVLTDDELAVLRFALEAELLVEPEGREALRRAIGDPEVDESAQVARDRGASSSDGGVGEGGA